MNAPAAVKPAWFPDWSGDACALIGSGPSARKEDIDRLRWRCRALVINTTYQLAPWADVLYACDGKWWDWHKGAVEFKGLRVTWDGPAAKRYGLHRIDLVLDGKDENVLSRTPGLLARGSNSAYQALNLALQFGARRIALLGVDFYGQRWHGAHLNGRAGQSQKTLARWRDIFDAAAPTIGTFAAEVVNLSAESTLTAYPKMSVDEMLARWGL